MVNKVTVAVDGNAEEINWIEAKVDAIMAHDDVINLAKFREIFDLKQVSETFLCTE